MTALCARQTSACCERLYKVSSRCRVMTAAIKNAYRAVSEPTAWTQEKRQDNQ